MKKFYRCRDVLAAAAVLWVAATADPVSAQDTDAPSLCSRAREMGWGGDRDAHAGVQGYALADFCIAMKKGSQHLSRSRHDPAGAYAAYADAWRLAATLAASERARGRDEARVGRALALEQLAEPEAALALIGEAPAARPYYGQFAEGYMLARRGFYERAAQTLRQAQQVMPAYWCAEHEAAAVAFAAGRLPESDGPEAVPIAVLQGIYVQDTLSRAYRGQCAVFASKGSGSDGNGVFPVTFRFGSGQAGIAETTENRSALKAMLAMIAAYGNHYRFTLQGHADQQCPRAAASPAECRRANLALSRQRVESARAMLQAERADIAAPAIEWFGMDRPAIDRPGKAEAANRRVTLVPAPARTAAATGRCPASLTAYFPELGPADGRPSLPSRIEPGAAARIASASMLFEVALDPAARIQGADMLYVQAEIEKDGTPWYADLAAGAGLPAPAADRLFATGRLPAAGPTYFGIDRRLLGADSRLTVRVISVSGQAGPRRTLFDLTRADPTRFAIEEPRSGQPYRILRLQRPLALAIKGSDGRVNVAALDGRSDPDSTADTKGPRTQLLGLSGAVVIDQTPQGGQAIVASPSPPSAPDAIEIEQCEFRFAFAK